MKSQTGKVHVARYARVVQIAENTDDPLSMRGVNARGIAALMQPFQSPMPETADHAAI